MKGNGFADGVYMKMNTCGELVTVNTKHMGIEENFVLSVGMSTQMYRNINFATVKELEG